MNTINLEFRLNYTGGSILDTFPDAPESPKVGELVLVKNGRYRVIDVIRHHIGVGTLHVTAIVENDS